MSTINRGQPSIQSGLAPLHRCPLSIMGDMAWPCKMNLTVNLHYHRGQPAVDHPWLYHPEWHGLTLVARNKFMHLGSIGLWTVGSILVWCERSFFSSCKFVFQPSPPCFWGMYYITLPNTSFLAYVSLGQMFETAQKTVQKTAQNNNSYDAENRRYSAT